MEDACHGSAVEFPHHLCPQDFLMTTIFAVFWLTCTSAWAKGLQNLKYATGTVGIVATLAVCREKGVTCEVTELASMRSLNVSVVSLLCLSLTLQGMSDTLLLLGLGK